MRGFAPGTQRTLLITAAWIFGLFLVVAFTFRRVGGSQDALGVVAGVGAYVFLAAAALILWRGWRRGTRDAGATAQRFAIGHPAVVEALGEPVEVGDPEGEIPRGSGAAQANLAIPVRGTEESGTVDLVMARIGRHWEVLSATLEVDGDRVPLADGGPGGSRDES